MAQEKKFEGKKLLLLGSNVGTSDLLTYAKENGAYTIVADNLPEEKSFCKRYADKSVLISTADIEQLEVLIRREKIDGVLAGISEFNLLSAMKLCEDLSLPFYCTRRQWDMIEDKEQFRQLCRDHGVPSPQTFFSGSEPTRDILNRIVLPVVVKPVDSSSSIGVHICRKRDDLVHAVNDAFSHSVKKRIIIEEFFEGEEFTAHYSIVNKDVSLACIDNRVPVFVHQGDVTSVPIARLYPSSFTEEYLKQVDGKMIDLCKSLDLDCGVLFVQGLYNKPKNRFVIFEAGLRCAGEAPYRFLEKINGVNFFNSLVDYSLLGKTDSRDAGKNDEFLNGRYACVLSFVSKGGTIAGIDNFDNIERRIPSIIDKECRYKVGDNTPSGDTLRQIVLRFVLVCDSQKQMVEDIERINDTVKVLSDKGDDLCFTFDVNKYTEFFVR